MTLAQWRTVSDTAINPRLNSLVHTEVGKHLSNLAGLAIGLLGQQIQRNKMHDPVEDAYAPLEIFLKHRDLFEEAVLHITTN